MNFTRTYDTEFIRKCLTDDTVWRMSSDDTPLDKDLVFPAAPVGDAIIWLRAEDYGVFLGERKNHVTYEVHTVLLPHARGKAAGIAKGAMQWLFDNTNCLRITTSVPSYNRLAARLAERSDMQLFGTNYKSFQKDGVLFDQLLFGLNKEASCQQ